MRKNRFKTFYRLSEGMLEQTKPSTMVLAKAETRELIGWLRVVADPVPQTGLTRWVGKPCSEIPASEIGKNPTGFLPLGEAR